MSGLETNILLLSYSNELAVFEAVVAQSVDDDDGSLYMSLVDTSWKTQRRGNDIVFMFAYSDWDAFTDWCSLHSLTIMKINESEWRLNSTDASAHAGARSVCSETDRNGTDNIMDRAVDKLRAGQSMFITGEGGCGKSHLAWQLYEFAVGDMKWDPAHICITAYTGVAAQELLGKKPSATVLARDVSTLHSFMGMTPGIKSFAQLQQFAEKDATLRARWTNTFMLIIDEISMVDSALFTILYEMRARFNNRMVVLCLGDFCQLPPHDITVRDTRTGQVTSTPDFCFQCPAWRTLIGRHVITLTTNYRVDNDREWRKLLTRMRMGHQTDQDRRFLCRLQPSEERMVTADHVHIYCRRKQVKEYNDTYFQKLTADGRQVAVYKLEWTSMERILNPRSRAPVVTTIPVSQMPDDAREFTMKLVGQASGLPDNELLPTEVRLCNGARVIYERNLLEQGLGNGMQGTVVNMQPDFVEVLFDNQSTPLRVLFIEHTEISDIAVVNGQQVQYKATCSLLPLQLAGAITVHKSQGMTLNKVYIKLFDENVVNGRMQRYCTIDFPGQVYVALSRGRASANIIVDSTFSTDADWQRVKPHPDVVSFYSSLSDVTSSSAAASSASRPRSTWGNLLDPLWLNRQLSVTETPLFILYKREKEYNDRLQAERWKKRLKKTAAYTA